MQPNNQDQEDNRQDNLPAAQSTSAADVSVDADQADVTSQVITPSQIPVDGLSTATAPQEQNTVVGALGDAMPVSGASPAMTSLADSEMSVPSDVASGPQTPVVTASQMAPIAAATPKSGGKGGKKVLIAIIAAVVLALLAAGAAGAYFGVYLPNQPQKIIGDGLSSTINSKQLKSTGFEGELQFSGGDIAKTVSSIGFEGKIDSASKTGEAAVSLNTAVTTVKLDARFPNNDNLYLKLSGLNGLDKLMAAAGGDTSSSYGMYASLISGLNDQWFFVNKSLISQYTSSTIPAESGNGSISEADAKKLGDIYKDNQFIHIDQKLADETINGVASYHMKASIDKGKLKSFVESLKAADVNGAKLEQKDIDAITKADFSKYPFEIWVGKKDRFVTQLKVSFAEKDTKYTVRFALRDINKPVSVQEPTNAKSIMDLVGSGMQMGGSDVLGINTSATDPIRLLENLQ